MTLNSSLPAECLIDIAVEAPQWTDHQVATEHWVHRVVAAALPSDHGSCELGIVFSDDEKVRALNARFRGHDAPTNVLSFPSPESPTLDALVRSGAPRPLGDVIIAFETAQREAAAEGKDFTHHVTHLLVHGVLHLLGYDHQVDAEADMMETRERVILDQLAVPDPYCERRTATGDAASDNHPAARSA